MKYLFVLIFLLFSKEAWVSGPDLGYTLSKDGLFMIITGDSSISFDYIDSEGGESEKKELSKKGEKILSSLEEYLDKVRGQYKGNLSSWLYEKDQGKKLYRIDFELEAQIRIEFAFVKPIKPKDLEELKKQFIKAYKSSSKK